MAILIILGVIILIVMLSSGNKEEQNEEKFNKKRIQDEILSGRISRKEGYINSEFYKQNLNFLSKKKLIEPKEICLHVKQEFTKYSRVHLVVTYDDLNKHKYWDSSEFLLLLLHANKIIVYKTIDYFELLRLYGSENLPFNFTKSPFEALIALNFMNKTEVINSKLPKEFQDTHNIISIGKELLDHKLFNRSAEVTIDTFDLKSVIKTLKEVRQEGVISRYKEEKMVDKTYDAWTSGKEIWALYREAEIIYLLAQK